MKAPEKIYLGIQDVGSGYVYDLSLNNNGEQEYIRKDAILEWANNWKKLGVSEDFLYAIDTLVLHLNSV